MARTPSIRPFMADEWRTYKALRLRALTDSPDAFGATLAGEEARTDTEWANRLQSGADQRWNLALVAEVDTKPIGLAWGRIEKSNPDVANVYQMWVAPAHRQSGVGRLLLERIIAWAQAMKVRRIALSVTCGDTAASRLYTRAGFKPVGTPQPLRPGSDLLAQPMEFEVADDPA
jgi:GNAT superfamily N-acetyltransferase